MVVVFFLFLLCRPGLMFVGKFGVLLSQSGPIVFQDSTTFAMAGRGEHVIAGNASQPQVFEGGDRLCL